MFLLIDKPQGKTSHDIVEKVRRLYREEKVGHGWTLDPMATWLLIVAVWKDTKKLDSFLGAEKTYETTINFAISSDTRDLDYWKEIVNRPINDQEKTICINEQWLSFPTEQQIEEKLQLLIWTQQIPLTPFSAKKIQGKKLYEYAREWNPVFIDIPMTVYKYELLDISFPTVTIRFSVWSGTYIRSLGYRLGKQFGLWWTLTMLKRLSVDSWKLPE